MTRTRKDWAIFAALWAVFIVIGEALAQLNLLPAQYAKEAKVVDDAYLLLIMVAVPIFAMVAAALLTITVRFVDWRSTLGSPATEDGAPIHNVKRAVPTWVLISAILCVIVAINPGFVGLRDLRGDSHADLVVKVTGQRWSWSYQYENGAVSTTELVLPVDERVRFDITSIDIIHSMWIPSFRTKLDAVPGRITKLYATPNRIGSGADDPNLRVQCAELCGLGHAAMSTPVRVVSKADFTAWLDGLAKEG